MWVEYPFSCSHGKLVKSIGSEVKWKSLSCVQLFASPWFIQSMEFSRPECWSWQPFTSPGDLPNPEIKPRSPALQADSLPAEPQWKLRNTGVGSLSLLQGIFLTQESNRGFCIAGGFFTNWAMRGQAKFWLHCPIVMLFSKSDLTMLSFTLVLYKIGMTMKISTFRIAVKLKWDDSQ